ncbi:MAG: hypothetical protein ACVCEJ_07245 [Candidatus Izemoplasmataceae bacterium]
MMSPLSYIVSMSMYVLFLFMFLDYTREKQKFYFWFFILALVSIPLWFINLESMFRWAKTISVLLPIAFVSFVRYANNGKNKNFMPFLRKKWPLWFFYFIVALNILEASLTDISLGNMANAISGFILIITMPLPTKNRWFIAKYDGKNNFGELIAEIPLAWCLLYVTWNACFVYAENTLYFASSLCILLVCELWILWKKRTDLWLMGRIYTLAIHILIRASFDVFTPVMGSSNWFNADVLYFWGIINLVLHGGYLVYWAIYIRDKDITIKCSAKEYGYKEIGLHG